MRDPDVRGTKIENANTRENRVTSTVETLKAVNNTKTSAEEKAVKDALAAVQADTGVQKALSIISEAQRYSPGDFRKAEEKSNEPFYESQIKENIPVFSAGSFSLRISPTPLTPTLPVIVSPPPPPVKTATLDIILFNEESIPTDGMFDQIFENIGGQELISITRSDIVNGQKISYQPIKNLSAIQQRYNSSNILSLQQTANKFFAGFSIKLEDKTPQIGNGPNGENVYLNATGDLIIEFININADEQIETQISVSGTIYEADLGDYTSW